MNKAFENPFRPGAGHQPPYLAGRAAEQDEMKRYLSQPTITQNVILTGLRGVGKTVLLETFKPLAQGLGWAWAGADLSESASVSDETIAIRVLTDISIVTSSYSFSEQEGNEIGFLRKSDKVKQFLNYDILMHIYNTTPGLVSDKLKNALEISWRVLEKEKSIKGIVFAYDEAQNLNDHAQQKQYPLSILLEVFQSIQRKNIPFVLILTGLPTLFPKLVEARTYAERMFHIIFLNQLDKKSSKEAIVKPVEDAKCPIKFNTSTVNKIIKSSGGYPYFIQYICKEIYDAWITKLTEHKEPSVFFDDIIRKLDIDFFQGRWSNITDRQRELLKSISELENCDEEFTVQEISNISKKILNKGFSPSHINQMLVSLSGSGLVFKNRFGKYSLAVPLLSQFIRRQNI